MLCEITAVASAQHLYLGLHCGREVQHHHDSSVCHSVGAVSGHIADSDSFFHCRIDRDIIIACSRFTDQPDTVRKLLDHLRRYREFFCYNDTGTLDPIDDLFRSAVLIYNRLRRQNAEVQQSVIIHFCRIQNDYFLIAHRFLLCVCTNDFSYFILLR